MQGIPVRMGMPLCHSTENPIQTVSYSISPSQDALLRTLMVWKLPYILCEEYGGLLADQCLPHNLRTKLLTISNRFETFAVS
jgi:hypothetical protein